MTVFLQLTAVAMLTASSGTPVAAGKGSEHRLQRIWSYGIPVEGDERKRRHGLIGLT